MANSLKSIRERKKLSLSQLAAKASIPTHVLTEYDEGRRPIPLTHLRMLAKALWVTAEEIEAQPPPSPPVEPRHPPGVQPQMAAPVAGAVEASVRPLSSTGLAEAVPPAQAAPGAAGERPTPSRPRTRTSAPPAPITDGQVNEIKRLSGILGLEADALAERVGKPLEELTRVDARQFIGGLRKEVTDAGLSLKGAKSIREAPDFEPRYLQEQLDEGATLTFTMYDGSSFSGVIAGFDPYTITIRDPATGDETVLRKLAMVYYRKTRGQA